MKRIRKLAGAGAVVASLPVKSLRTIVFNSVIILQVMNCTVHALMQPLPPALMRRQAKTLSFTSSGCRCTHNAFRHPNLTIVSSSSSLSLSLSTHRHQDSTILEIQELKRELAEATELMLKNQQSVGTTPEMLAIRIADLEREQSDPNFWDNNNDHRVAVVNQQLAQATSLATRLKQWREWHGDATAAVEMLKDGSLSMDKQEVQLLLEELRFTVKQLSRDNQKAELEWLLSGPFDDAPARIMITAGAGGTEATDWVEMLFRMYQRYCSNSSSSNDNNNSTDLQNQPQFTCTVEDTTAGDQCGYKSVQFLIRGPRAYGWWRGEKGAHRLVRISPFNAQNKRQTTFAGVDVSPDLDGTFVHDIVVPDSDLEITASRSGGKGGQNVNKVSSAVRVKHIPSGLAVRCTEQRSQLMNKALALTRLKAQLLAVAQEQRCQEIRQIRGDVVEASWGAQIRTYVLHPYKQVKDPRTGWETSNAEAFLDGELLDDCIGAYLRYKAQMERQEQEQEQQFI